MQPDCIVPAGKTSVLPHSRPPPWADHKQKYGTALPVPLQAGPASPSNRSSGSRHQYYFPPSLSPLTGIVQILPELLSTAGDSKAPVHNKTDAGVPVLSRLLSAPDRSASFDPDRKVWFSGE